jgi:hypothetical protein
MGVQPDAQPIRGEQAWENAHETMIYRCFELIPERGFVVQSADRIHLPVDMEQIRNHERQFWELFCEEAPDERDAPSASLEEAIAAFDANFGN